MREASGGSRRVGPEPAWWNTELAARLPRLLGELIGHSDGQSLFLGDF